MNKLLFSLFFAAGLVATAQAQTAPSFSGIALTPSAGVTFPLTYLTQESAPITATVKNTYLGSTATISAVTSSDPQYVVTAETCTAAPLAKNGGTCTVTIKYVPSAVTAASSAKITVTRTTAGGNFWIPVAGSADTVPKVPTLPAATTFSGISQTPAQGLAFAELLPGQVSANQTVTLKNTYLGSTASISAVTSSDPQFEVVAETCTAAPLAKNGGSCTVDVRFKPSAAGTFAAKLNVTRTSAGGSFFTSLAGIGKGTAVVASAAGASLTPTSLTFPSTVVGQAAAEQTVTLKNTFAASSWTVNSVTSNLSSYKVLGHDCGTLAPGATCTIRVGFMPTLAQALKGTLSINRTVGTASSVVALKVTGAGVAATAPNPLKAEPGAVTFAAAPVKQAAGPAVVTLTNVGTSAITMAGVKSSLADVTTQYDCPASLAVGASCKVTLVFTPAAEGTRSGTVSITQTYNGVSGHSDISFVGTGLAPSPFAVTPTSVDFGDNVYGVNAQAQTVTLTNTSASAASFNGLTLSATDVKVTSSCPSTLSAGQSCTLSLAYQPAAPGVVSTTALATGTGVSSLSLPIRGRQFEPPLVGLNQNVFLFGVTALGNTSATQTVTVSNTGKGPLRIANIIPSDNQWVVGSNTCATDVAANGKCSFTLAFRPGATTEQHGTVTLQTNIGDETLHVWGNMPASAIRGVCDDTNGGQVLTAPVSTVATFGQVMGASKDGSTLVIQGTRIDDLGGNLSGFYVFKKNTVGKFVFDHMITDSTGKNFEPPYGMSCSGYTGAMVCKPSLSPSAYALFIDDSNRVHMFIDDKQFAGYALWVATPDASGKYVVSSTPYPSIYGANATWTGSSGLNFEGPFTIDPTWRVWGRTGAAPGIVGTVSGTQTTTWTNPNTTLSYAFPTTTGAYTFSVAKVKSTNALETEPLLAVGPGLDVLAADSKEYVLLLGDVNPAYTSPSYSPSLAVTEWRYNATTGKYARESSLTIPSFRLAGKHVFRVVPGTNNSEVMIAGQGSLVTLKRTYDSIVGRYNWTIKNQVTLPGNPTAFSTDGQYLYTSQTSGYYTTNSAGAVIADTRKSTMTIYRRLADGSLTPYAQVSPAAADANFGLVVVNPLAASRVLYLGGTNKAYVCK